MRGLLRAMMAGAAGLALGSAVWAGRPAGLASAEQVVAVVEQGLGRGRGRAVNAVLLPPEVLRRQLQCTSPDQLDRALARLEEDNAFVRSGRWRYFGRSMGEIRVELDLPVSVPGQWEDGCQLRRGGKIAEATLRYPLDGEQIGVTTAFLFHFPGEGWFLLALGGTVEWPWLDEVLVNVDGIRTAQLGYEAAFDQFVAVAEPVPRPREALDAREVSWISGTDFDVLGWAPDGPVACTYQVDLVGYVDFEVHGYCDLDNDERLLHVVATREHAAAVTSSLDER